MEVVTLAAVQATSPAALLGTAQHRVIQRACGGPGRRAVAALDVLIVQRLDSTLFPWHQDGMGFSFFFCGEMAWDFH
jgi:hypothetical protein